MVSSLFNDLALSFIISSILVFTLDRADVISIERFTLETFFIIILVQILSITIAILINLIYGKIVEINNKRLSKFQIKLVPLLNNILEKDGLVAKNSSDGFIWIKTKMDNSHFLRIACSPVSISYKWELTRILNKINIHKENNKIRLSTIFSIVNKDDFEEVLLNTSYIDFIILEFELNYNYDFSDEVEYDLIRNKIKDVYLEEYENTKKNVFNRHVFPMENLIDFDLDEQKVINLDKDCEIILTRLINKKNKCYIAKYILIEIIKIKCEDRVYKILKNIEKFSS